MWNIYRLSHKKGMEVTGTSMPLTSYKSFLVLLHVEGELKVDAIHNALEYQFTALRTLRELH